LSSHQIFETSLDIKFHYNLFCGSQVQCGRTNGQRNKHTWQSQ